MLITLVMICFGFSPVAAQTFTLFDTSGEQIAVLTATDNVDGATVFTSHDNLLMMEIRGFREDQSSMQGFYEVRDPDDPACPAPLTHPRTGMPLRTWGYMTVRHGDGPGALDLTITECDGPPVFHLTARMQAPRATADPVPVMLGVDPDHGTCSLGWQVNEGGAEMRQGPGAGFALVAMLPEGRVVAGCETRNGWEGVIDGQNEACSVGIQITERRPYSGPCPSGWIDQSQITQVAG